MTNVFKGFVIIISLGATSLAQTNQQPSRESSSPAQSITRPQIKELHLERRGFRPKLSLQRALELADDYVEKKKINIKPYYLYEAKYVLYGSRGNQEPCWYFWWVNESGALGDYVEIIVSIETGNVSRIPSM